MTVHASSAEYWMRVALHLADIHAANAEREGTLKSCSKSRRLRFAKICNTSLHLLEAKPIETSLTRWEDEESIRDRLKEAISSLLQTGEKDSI